MTNTCSHATGRRDEECDLVAGLTRELAEANANYMRVIRERDAYRKAKEENDERFMLERDHARAERDEARAGIVAGNSVINSGIAANMALREERDALRAEVDRLKADVANGMHCYKELHDKAEAELTRLRGVGEAAKAWAECAGEPRHIGAAAETWRYVGAAILRGEKPGTGGE